MRELRRGNKSHLIPAIKSLIDWSRTAETALSNPGKAYSIKLSHKPELLDKLIIMTAEEFVRKYPKIKERNYEIYFDGEDLFIN